MSATDRPSPPTPKKLRRQAELGVLAAAIEYHRQTTEHGSEPAMAAARLRIAAHAYGKAVREAGELP